MGVDYGFTIDSYNDSGLTYGTAVTVVPATLPAPPPKPVQRPLELKDPEITQGFAATYANDFQRSANTSLGTNPNAPGAGYYIIQNMHNSGAWCHISDIAGSASGSGVVKISTHFSELRCLKDKKPEVMKKNLCV
jgi:hypothetical protein